MDFFTEAYWGQWAFDGLALLALIVIMLLLRPRR